MTPSATSRSSSPRRQRAAARRRPDSPRPSARRTCLLSTRPARATPAPQTGTRPEKLRIQKWYTVYKDHITLDDYEIHDGMGLELYYN